MNPYDRAHPLKGRHDFYVYDIKKVDEQKVRAEAIAFAERGETTYVHCHEKRDQALACEPTCYRILPDMTVQFFDPLSVNELLRVEAENLGDDLKVSYST